MNILSLVFPEDLYCVSCGRPLPSQENDGVALCDRCAGEIEWVRGRCCGVCGRPLSNENPGRLCRDCAGAPDHSFSKGWACVLYSGRAAGIVRDMKYREKDWYCDTLAAFMAKRLLAETDPDTGELPCYDYIAAVPMAGKKRESRGYDQAALLARRLSRRIGVPYLKKAIMRVRETGVMSSLSRDERRQNLAFAFSVGYDKIETISAKRILLVDDVYTTGSSVDACAETLMAAGAGSVDVIVFAIGADHQRHETYAADQGVPERGRPSGCG